MNRSKYPSVMLIDDQPLDNAYNEELIRNQKLADTVYIHTTAISALEYLKNIANLDHAPEILIPRIVFLDIYMPEMDGFSFIREYQKLPQSIREKISIVLVSSSASNNDQQEAHQNSTITQFIKKPLTPQALQHL